MAKNTKRRELTPLWMFPVDMVSFSQSQCVTDILEEGLSDANRVVSHANIRWPTTAHHSRQVLTFRIWLKLLVIRTHRLLIEE